MTFRQPDGDRPEFTIEGHAPLEIGSVLTVRRGQRPERRYIITGRRPEPNGAITYELIADPESTPGLS